jgi:hypothetical protein
MNEASINISEALISFYIEALDRTLNRELDR